MINILLILEGNEEETLFNIAKNNGFSNKFNVTFINAKGFGNVPLFYQANISNPYYDLILCVYDVDNKVFEKESPYNKIRNVLKNILLSDEKVDAVSICTNPNILQFLLLGADKLQNVKLISTSKALNTSIIHKYWNEIGLNKEYDAKKWQLDIIENSYKYEIYQYSTLLENAKELDTIIKLVFLQVIY